MSHQTGIQANEELQKFFGECKDGSVRVIQVEIVDEELKLKEYREPELSWEDDYEKHIGNLIQENKPCYLFYCLDDVNMSGQQWLFISWCPDTSSVREKMLYASTKATMKKEFGAGQIKYELFGSHKEDISLQGYYKHIQSEKAPAPLTGAEQELLAIKRSESGANIGIDEKHQTIQGLLFPIADDALSALKDLKENVINYVQLSIDVDKEEINLESFEDTNIQMLASRVPTEHARYHLFRFPHNYEGDYFVSIVFIYSVPGYNCPIKERMLYSTCKSQLLEVIETKIGIEIAKRIEIDDASELTADFLIDEIHPKKNIFRQKFAKPKPPSNRGARRLICTQKEKSQAT